jgi:hypothetical protein
VTKKEGTFYSPQQHDLPNCALTSYSQATLSIDAHCPILSPSMASSHLPRDYVLTLSMILVLEFQQQLHASTDMNLKDEWTFWTRDEKVPRLFLVIN